MTAIFENDDAPRVVARVAEKGFHNTYVHPIKQFARKCTFFPGAEASGSGFDR